MKNTRCNPQANPQPTNHNTTETGKIYLSPYKNTILQFVVGIVLFVAAAVLCCTAAMSQSIYIEFVD